MTTIVTDAPVDAEQILRLTERFEYANPFYQLVHLANAFEHVEIAAYKSLLALA